MAHVLSCLPTPVHESPSNLKIQDGGIIRIHTSTTTEHLPMESKLSDETLDVLPILLDDNTTDMGLALVHLSDVTQAGIQAANQGNRWAFVAVSDTLADTFEKQYSIGSHSASASIAASLESLAMGASASVSASASASTSISASATAAASTAITTAAEEEDEQTAATTGLSAQLLISLCNMHNRLAVQLLQGCSDKSVESITLSSHLPLLRTLVPALAAAAHGQASAAGRADTGAWQAASKDAAAILQALRRFWLLHGLLDDRMERSASAATGAFAFNTPELAPVSFRDEEEARVAAEMRPLLQQLGQIASASSLHRVLQGLLPEHTKLPRCGNAAPSCVALLIAGAAMHSARARWAPLSLLSGEIPFASLLHHLQVLPPGSREHERLSHAAHASFTSYLDRLSDSPTEPVDSEDDRLAAQAGLASGLLPFLVAGSYESGSQVAAVVEGWLSLLLDRLPWLQWHLPFVHSLAAAWDATHPGVPRMTVHHGATGAHYIEKLLRLIARQGAEEAPQWTMAVHHAATRFPEDPSSAVGAAAIIVEIDRGRMASTIGDGTAPFNGDAEAMDTKAIHIGRIRGAIKYAIDQGRAPESVASACLENLQQSTCEAPAQQDALLQAAAAVAVLQGGSEVSQLAHALAWAPSRRLAPTCGGAASVAWLWVCIEAPHLLADMVVRTVESLKSSAAAREGLFGRQPFTADIDPSGNALEGGETIETLEDAVVVSSISAQHTCILLLLQTWRVCRTAAGVAKMTAAAALQQGLLSLLTSGRAPISTHPAAAGALFRLALLTLEAARGSPSTRWPQEDISLRLQDAALHLALAWFYSPPAWHGSCPAAGLREQAQAVVDFSTAAHATWGAAPKRTSPASWPLLKLLLQVEADRLGVWADPSGDASPPSPDLSQGIWAGHVAAAWQVDPKLALALRQQFPGIPALTRALESLVRDNAADGRLQRLPEAAMLLAVSAEGAALQHLQHWATAPLLQATRLLAGKSGESDFVRQYALRSLTACRPEEVAFFLPQLVQLLRNDKGSLVENFLLDAAVRSFIFAHLLLCALKTEGRPPEDALNPTVKRSGWQPPQNTGLWEVTDAVQDRVWQRLPDHVASHLQAELSFFDQVTAVSGKLYEVEKLQRKAKAVELLRDVTPSRSDLYLPTDPKARVLAVIPSSATPMQSAAKVPILVAFEVERSLPLVHDREKATTVAVNACIFKVGDDCRQDVLALQVIGLLKEAFEKAGLDLYLAPYGVVPTDYECGIIQVVPDCASRSALGETCDGGLRQIFTREFGPAGSPAFERARFNFLRSQAGYAIACFLLQVKDRHNGNVMIDRDGHLVHIDFGFLLEISPGGNLGFESAPFKFSHEMTQLLDPSGNKASMEYETFEAQCIRGYLAARGVAEGILATVELMAASGLPCFGRGAPVANMRRRFNLEMTDRQAARFMQKSVRQAYNKWTTGFYDVVQYLQNNIPN